MKKILYNMLLSVLLFLSFSGEIRAAEEVSILYDGFTDEKIHYSVYMTDTPTTQDVQTYTPSYYQYVERLVVYDDVVSPPQSIYYEEYIHGYLYAGNITLYLVQVDYNRTYAHYRGNIYIKG